MGSSEWFELETLNTQIAHSRARLEAARKTKNHGYVKVLQREIARSGKRCALNCSVTLPRS